MSRCESLHSLVFLDASQKSRGISTFRGWEPNSVWCVALTFFSFNFLFSFPPVAIISLTEVWCAHMGIITLFGIICVEQTLKYGQERSFCVGLCEQNTFVSFFCEFY